MNLNKDETNPARALKWAGKSLLICSRKELVECVVAQARMLGQMQQQINTQAGMIKELENKATAEMVAENAG